LDYGGGQALMTAFHDTGYLFTVLAVNEAVAGALLLAGRFVPFALTLLGATVLNVVVFHLTLDATPRGLAQATLVAGLTGALAWAYRTHYRELFRVR
ncbi:MAG: hypothetical protein ACRCY9_20565, partial [Phycicoccus sp.]